MSCNPRSFGAPVFDKSPHFTMTGWYWKSNLSDPDDLKDAVESIDLPEPGSRSRSRSRSPQLPLMLPPILLLPLLLPAPSSRRVTSIFSDGTLAAFRVPLLGDSSALAHFFGLAFNADPGPDPDPDPPEVVVAVALEEAPNGPDIMVREFDRL